MEINKIYKPVCYLLLLVSVFFFLSSCSEEDHKPSACIMSIMPDTLMFRVVDQHTGEDLFFGEEPLYSIDDLHVLHQNIRDPSRFDTVRISQKAGCFHVPLSMGQNTNTMYLSIADTPLDTLTYTVKPAVNLGCTTVILDGLVFNHSQIEKNIHGREVTLRK